MSFEELAAIGEFIGGVTIVLTLLYLAYETRRNTAIHIASTTSDAYLRWAECNQLIAGEVRVTELWVRIFDNQPLDAFDTVERLQITLEMRALVQRREVCEPSAGRCDPTVTNCDQTADCWRSGPTIQAPGNTIENGNPSIEIFLEHQATWIGCLAAIRSKAIAGPSGRRRPCSQFRSV
jgi:hypothetical protein